MKINLSPQRRAGNLEVSKSDDVLTINGDVLDLSIIGEGDAIEDAGALSSWLSGTITRQGGEVELTLLVPVPPAAPALEPLLNVPDGAVPVPQFEYD